MNIPFYHFETVIVNSWNCSEGIDIRESLLQMFRWQKNKQIEMVYF